MGDCKTGCSYGPRFLYLDKCLIHRRTHNSCYIWRWLKTLIFDLGQWRPYNRRHRSKGDSSSYLCGTSENLNYAFDYSAVRIHTYTKLRLLWSRFWGNYSLIPGWAQKYLFQKFTVFACKLNLCRKSGWVSQRQTDWGLQLPHSLTQNHKIEEDLYRKDDFSVIFPMQSS